MEPRDRIIVALDVDSPATAAALAAKLVGHIGALKVGKEFFVSAGPAVTQLIDDLGLRVFLDLKFHDIPNTVAGAVRAAARLGVWMVNVHASGGAAMCRAAAQAAHEGGGERARPLVIGVTVLTSLDQADLDAIGFTGSPHDAALRLAKLAKDNGLDGVVASAQEAAAIKELCGREFLVVTPGIRPADAAAGDQKRIMTPAAAIAAGADYLVIGRPIIRAPEPAAAADAIAAEIAAALETTRT
jgi:orotidine-5'-phosphate decarboxylase